MKAQLRKCLRHQVPLLVRTPWLPKVLTLKGAWRIIAKYNICHTWFKIATMIINMCNISIIKERWTPEKGTLLECYIHCRWIFDNEENFSCFSNLDLMLNYSILILWWNGGHFNTPLVFDKLWAKHKYKWKANDNKKVKHKKMYSILFNWCKTYRFLIKDHFLHNGLFADGGHVTTATLN